MAVSSNETLNIGQYTDKNLPRLFGLGSLVVASVLVAFIALTIYRFNSFQKLWVAHSEESNAHQRNLGELQSQYGLWRIDP